MSLPSFLAVPELAARYRKIKPFFSLRTSVYDVSADCQLRCQGCSFFAGEMANVHGVRESEKWRELMESEVARGINFANLAGAEPSLAPDVVRACHSVIPRGTVVTNGLKPLPPDINGYKIHISIWGNDASDPAFRPYLSGKPGTGNLRTALASYANDPRAIFVYTFNGQNTGDIDETAARIAGAGHKLTFSVFSSRDADATSPLRIASSLHRTRDKMLQIMDRFPDSIVYSRYNAEVHTSPQSLRDQFGCPFPRATKSDTGIAATFRNYRADLTHIGDQSCCTPYQSCADCRVYAAGAVIVPASLYAHAQSESAFRGWLDYVDTFLAVYIAGYSQDQPLYAGAAV